MTRGSEREDYEDDVNTTPAYQGPGVPERCWEPAHHTWVKRHTDSFLCTQCGMITSHLRADLVNCRNDNPTVDACTMDDCAKCAGGITDDERFRRAHAEFLATPRPPACSTADERLAAWVAYPHGPASTTPWLLDGDVDGIGMVFGCVHCQRPVVLQGNDGPKNCWWCGEPGPFGRKLDHLP